MQTVHRIGLRGGWTVTPQPDGRFRHTRRFGSPRTLDPTELVYLTVAMPILSVTLNGEQLVPVQDKSEFEITSRLQPRNEVAIETTQLESIGDVALEFRKRDKS